jgi:hypothetical protein
MHYKIWEDQNRSIKRTFFWSIIFFTLATVLLLQTPELIRRIGSKELELRKIESQLKAVEEQQVLLSDFQDQLTDVSGHRSYGN